LLHAVANVEETISPELVGSCCADQAAVDRRLCEIDGTVNKSKLGANAILGVSMACAVVTAQVLKMPLFQYLGGALARQLPIPLINVLNGGAHAENTLDFQEFMIVPHLSGTFFENIRAGAEIFHALKKLLKKEGLATGLGDEGGFAPNLTGGSEQALDFLIDAIEAAGYTPGSEISLALDVAASEFFNREQKRYILKKSSGDSLTSSQLIDLYDGWLSKYPIVSIEDGLDENDWDGWIELTARLGARIQLVGDDLFVTNPDRLREGILKSAGNAILIKLNQIGTVSETMEAIRLAQSSGFNTVISHRSGETEDTFIADLAVACGAGQIKTGSVCRGERTAKYNRLLWIESYLQGESFSENPFIR
jgi:enolase